MSEIVTALEARVAPERAGELRAAYAELARGPFPAGLVRSALLRDTGDPSRWRIETVWKSRGDLDAMRRAGKPRGVQVFEAAGAEPSLAVYEAVAELLPPASAG